ncbi:DUF2510 domain-containing protein [Streptomyces sp. AA0539]|uniref:DUF2510 domain-containing protein n=1 Tax=Streptomyces sp. AA0539 TaxID=1210045 RepID=UPI0002EE64EA|nr:DUF2510 domain-containing protein [Streptomyces sp. AA0539]
MSADSSAPGWFPDPGHAGDGPAPERWWDGTAWTGETRAPAAPGPVASPGPPRRPSSGGARGRGAAVAVAVGSALMLAALVGGGALLLGNGADGTDGTDDAGDATAPASGPGPEGDREPAPGTAPLTRPGPGGLALPVLPGWQEHPPEASGGGLLVTTGGYPCPADPARSCVTAGAFLGPAGATAGTDPRQAAEADIAAHIEESFGAATYDGVRAQEIVLAEETTVAGERGYRIRTLLTTGAGIDAYAESVVFPAPDGSGQLLALRFGFDLGGEAPPAGDMDRITAGIRPPDGDGSRTG